MSLRQVQQELKAPKGQTNNFGKYKYRSCEDILEAVKPLLEKHGCTMVIHDDIVKVGKRIYVKASVDFTDGKITTSVSAFAREAETKKGMDDSQITGTASSYARKYALNGLFLIDDTKDADTDEHQKASDAAYAALVKEHRATIDCMSIAFAGGNLSTAKEAWDELTDDEKKALWRAPTKGGCFTVAERKQMREPEFRTANGENNND